MDIDGQLDNQIVDLPSYFQNQTQTFYLVQYIKQIAQNFSDKENRKYTNVITPIKRKCASGRKNLCIGGILMRSHRMMSAISYGLLATVRKNVPRNRRYFTCYSTQLTPARIYLKYVAKDSSIQRDRCLYGCHTYSIQPN